MKDQCKQFSEWLKEDLAGELEFAQQRELAAHLEGCPSCRREQLELEETWSRLREVEDESVPRHFLVYDDLPARSSGRWQGLVALLPLGWKVALGSLGVVFGLGLILMASQARIEVGPRSIALSFGPSQVSQTMSTPAEPGEGGQDLVAVVRSIVEEENRRWAAVLREEMETLIAQGAQADRASFELALTSLERRFEDRLGARDEQLQATFEKVLGDSIDLVNEQRRSEIAQIRQVLVQFADFNRYQAGQSTAIIQTLSQIADNRSELRGGTR